jgi:hypothetical protein
LYPRQQQYEQQNPENGSKRPIDADRTVCANVFLRSCFEFVHEFSLRRIVTAIPEEDLQRTEHAGRAATDETPIEHGTSGIRVSSVFNPWPLSDHSFGNTVTEIGSLL